MYLYLYLDILFNNWIYKLFSEENKVPRPLFEARKVANKERLFI